MNERIDQARAELFNEYVDAIAQRMYRLCPNPKQEEGDAFALLVGIYIGSTEHGYNNMGLTFRPIEERIHQIRIYQFVSDIKGVETLEKDIIVDIVQGGETYGCNLGELSLDEIAELYSFLSQKTDMDLLNNYQIECL